MNAIPDLDLWKIRKYAAGVVPEDFQDQIRIEVDLRGRTVTIMECRPPWREEFGPEWSRRGIARMKFDPATREWTLYWSDRNSRWHIFDLVSPGSIEQTLGEIESDRTNIFWADDKRPSGTHATVIEPKLGPTVNAIRISPIENSTPTFELMAWIRYRRGRTISPGRLRRYRLEPKVRATLPLMKGLMICTPLNSLSPSDGLHSGSTG